MAGARLALDDADGRAGPFELELHSLDGAEPGSGSTPQAADANARRAADDPDAIAYLGELDPGTAAVSLPVLNEAGLAQVGAASLPAGLTRAGPAAGAGEPERHYPSERRHFVRIVPSDELEADGVASLMRSDGCADAFLLGRTGAVASGRLRRLGAATARAGVAVAGEAFLPAEQDPDDAAELAGELRAAGARCLALAGLTAAELAPFAALLARAGPPIRVYGDERLADPGSSAPPGAAGAPLREALAVTGAALAPVDLDGALAGLAERYARQHGPPPDPWALYGYEAMSLVLDAIRRAGAAGDERAAVVARLFATHARRSVLGTYSIDRHGDTTLRRLGVWTPGSPAPEFRRTLELGADGG